MTLARAWVWQRATRLWDAARPRVAMASAQARLWPRAARLWDVARPRVPHTATTSALARSWQRAARLWDVARPRVSDGGSRIALSSAGAWLGHGAGRLWNVLRPRVRSVRFWALVTLGLLLAAALWIAITGWLARGELGDVRAAATDARAAAGRGDLPALTAAADDLRLHAARAHALTSDPVWSLASSVPWAGAPLRTVRGLSAAADTLGALTADLATLSDVARTTAGGVDLRGVEDVAAAVRRADGTVKAVQSTVDGLPHDTWLSTVDAARGEVAGLLSTAAPALDGADRWARVAPEVLGFDGPRRYFIGFLNEAQARGIGGIPGAFAIVEADHGVVRFREFAPDGALWNVPTGLDLGPEYDARYRETRSTDYIINSTTSPHFPYAARIWAAMWQREHGERIDGALAVDPTALSYLLTVTGPATAPGGERVDAGNVVALTQSTIYARYADPTPAGQAARKDYLIGLARAIEARILGGGLNPARLRPLAEAARRGATERRLLAWSADQTVQHLIEATPLAGEVEETAAPYSGVVVVNAGANKLDYYLDRTVTWRRTGCGDARDVTVTIALTNHAPAGLTPYVNQRLDEHAYPIRPGDQRLHLSYLATRGALLRAATIDGRRVMFTPGEERGHPAYLIDVELPRGATRTVTLHLREPYTQGDLHVLRQPLVRPLHFTSSSQECG
ncbi:DUF4012 domain-containing protein [Dactylosporangium sp. CS-033363]|uniref:DUF4012 domain-containing protein n=1 Tax=Dactylosporangium sp. CS-033363 TaxID=3239935 RepID=UPI003D8D9A86